MDYRSITEINEIVKSILENSDMLSEIYVRGEISNLKYHSRGHVYFSLKDENSKINAVFFNAGGKLLFEPKDGDSVLVRGKINVYTVSGNYQIVVSEMKQDGIGNLYVLFEELKKKLSLEGLFDDFHKKKIPKFPQKVGIITAREGAAVKDIITTINRRYPLCEIYLFPTLVQGEGAKEGIVKMIKRANETDIDVLIVGRGGGSIEDLWAFNEEIVARAIYDSKIPIVSAVGHEIDYTIADFVADLRAPTPTAAAELVVKNKEDIENYLSDVVNRLNTALLNKVNHYTEKINKYKTNYILNNPLRMYDIKYKEVEAWGNKLNSIIQGKLINYNNRYESLRLKLSLLSPLKIYEYKSENLKKIKEKLNMVINNLIYYNNNRFENLKLKLELLNPENIIEKGYSIVKINDKIIKNSKDIKIGENIDIILNKGKLLAEVKGKE